MSQHRLSSNRQPLATFMAGKAEIDDLLGRIQAGSAYHFNAQPDEVQWAMSAASDMSPSNSGRSQPFWPSDVGTHLPPRSASCRRGSGW